MLHALICLLASTEVLDPKGTMKAPGRSSVFAALYHRISAGGDLPTPAHSLPANINCRDAGRLQLVPYILC